jgi:hypothetical protein
MSERNGHVTGRGGARRVQYRPSRTLTCDRKRESIECLRSSVEVLENRKLRMTACGSSNGRALMGCSMSRVDDGVGWGMSRLDGFV